MTLLRPTPHRSLLGHVPLRLALVVLVLLVLALAVAVVVGMQFERHLLISSGAVPPEQVDVHRLTAGMSWPDLLMVVGTLLVLAAAAIVVFTSVQNYRAVTETFEHVKTLMRNVLESISTGVVTLDRLGCVTSVNRAAERLLGIRAVSAVGQPIGSVLSALPTLAGWVTSARAGEGAGDDTDLPVPADDGGVRTLRLSVAELQDEPGAGGRVILMRDVTQVRRLELQLRRADKLAALGTLAAGVAHEVKNPLHALSLNLHLLKRALRSPVPSRGDLDEYVEVLRTEIERIDAIVEGFLRLSRPSPPEMKSLALNALVERVLSLVVLQATEHGVAMHCELEPTSRTVLGDESQLEQVLLNLAINALQAMAAGGTLRLQTRYGDGTVELTVSDTGEGIPDDLLPHVFDPYFTTRAGGVGLGLAIAHRIVEAHQGSIDVESRPGQGTSIVVRLPLSPAQADSGAGR